MSDSDNPPNATSNITKGCSVCGGEFENAGGIFSTVDKYELGAEGKYGVFV